MDKPEELKSHFSFVSLNWSFLHAANGSHELCSELLVVIFLWAVLHSGLCLLLFHQKQNQILCAGSCIFLEIKSKIAANVPVITCSNEQTSTPVSKLTLQPEQPPQEQAWRFNFTGEIYFFLHRCVKVAHDNQVCDSHQLWHNRFSGVWAGSQEAPRIWASACNDTCYSKRKWFQLLTWGSTKSVPKRITENSTAILHIPQVPLN